MLASPLDSVGHIGHNMRTDAGSLGWFAFFSAGQGYLHRRMKDMPCLRGSPARAAFKLIEVNSILDVILTLVPSYPKTLTSTDDVDGNCGF